MPGNLVFQCFADKAERVHVFDFGFRAELLLPAWAHTDIGIAAQRAFLHVAVAHAGVKNDLLQPSQVFVGLVGSCNVRFADNLNQRHTAAVEINGGRITGAGKSLMQALARIFLKVNTGNSNSLELWGDGRPLPSSADIDLNKPMLGQRLVILRNLIPLGQVGIEVILPRKNRSFANLAIQCHRRQCGKLNRLPI